MSTIQKQRIKDKEKKLQKKLCQKDKCTEHNTKPTMDRDSLDLCLVRDNLGDLPCRDILSGLISLEMYRYKKESCWNF